MPYPSPPALTDDDLCDKCRRRPRKFGDFLCAECRREADAERKQKMQELVEASRELLALLKEEP
jgi:hypothetical protein